MPNTRAASDEAPSACLRLPSSSSRAFGVAVCMKRCGDDVHADHADAEYDLGARGVVDDHVRACYEPVLHR